METTTYNYTCWPIGYLAILIVIGELAISPPVYAYDVTDWLSVGGVVAATEQCQLLNEDAGGSDACRGALPAQPEVSIRPTDQDELFIKLGFAAGNGLNNVSPFTLASWAADLHDDVEDINGRYDYLLNAWYKHIFTFKSDTTLLPGATLGITAGIIDSTEYLDKNAYANDEYTQFMNEALVNGPNAFLPSYDVGGAVEFDTGPWSVRGVVMDIGENDDGNSFTFVGAQVGYTVGASWGEGTYRAIVVGASKEFLNPEGTSEESRFAVVLSVDQQLAETVGAWLRFGWQDDSAAIDYEAFYSGGINILGGPWGRPDDNIGIGYGFLDGGNLDIGASHIAEIYYRFAISDQFALTADAQYMKDNRRGDDNLGGFILSLRATAEF